MGQVTTKSARRINEIGDWTELAEIKIGSGPRKHCWNLRFDGLAKYFFHNVPISGITIYVDTKRVSSNRINSLAALTAADIRVQPANSRLGY